MKNFICLLSTVILLTFTYNIEVYAQSYFTTMLSTGVNPRQKTFNDIKNYILMSDVYSISNVEDNFVEFTHRQFVAGDKIWPNTIVVEKDGENIKSIREDSFFFGDDNQEEFIAELKKYNQNFPKSANPREFLAGKNIYAFYNMNVFIMLEPDPTLNGPQGYCPIQIFFKDWKSIEKESN